ncbi:MAG: DUF2815 family protein [Rhodoplanes sp.]|uniref:ssDNA-binding protein n=1 Tax=Rhodoplanes sp. TaxID=1968906 RepID=UPI00182815DC|nr:ssDNA-binding protein [Rhodoplanes sp.]NVO13838.1 DUF2815 family protein [Rhodoplanes sp.]
MAHNTIRSDTFLTPPMRGAYFFLHTLRTTDGNKQPLASPHYEFVGLVEKLNPDPTLCENYRMFATAAMGVALQVPEFGGSYPAGASWPIQDGDDPAKLVKSPWRKGKWVIKFSATEKFPPRVTIWQNGVAVDLLTKDIGGVAQYKSGDFLQASVYALSYDNKSRGVKFGIEGVCFVGPGEAIGGAQRSAAEMFKGVVGRAPPAAAAPGYGAPPPAAYGTPPAPGYGAAYAPPPPAAPGYSTAAPPAAPGYSTAAPPPPAGPAPGYAPPPPAGPALPQFPR